MELRINLKRMDLVPLLAGIRASANEAKFPMENIDDKLKEMFNYL